MSEAIILILTFLLFFLIAFFLFKKSNSNVKAPAVKKDELIKSYEDEMREILLKYKDSEELQKKKIEYLKYASHQLHNNIFFDAQEAKEIIKRLATF